MNIFFSRARYAVICLLLMPFGAAKAQDVRYIKQSIQTLASPGFGGRGYVGNSRDKAARFLARNFSEIGLIAFDSSPNNFYQEYYFPVNTFPNRLELKICKKQLEPGEDYLVDASSVGFRTNAAQKLKRVNLNKVKDSTAWQALLNDFGRGGIFQLNHWDSLCKRLVSSSRQLLSQLPKAAYIIPQKKKLIWTVATDTLKSTVFYVADSSMPKGRKVEAWVQQKFEAKSLNKNVLGYVKGTEIPDSFIVFTAHYDHLGKMGQKTIFPGANDNASGTAFLLALAQHYQANPFKYSVAFLMFSGEEAGLLGSSYYVQHPVFPLDQIKFLVNIDLMGDATQGVTVVNAMQQAQAYQKLTEINERKKYLPEIKKRDNAANSDHFPFTQVGVPAIFIYANGGKGYYHDIYDKPKEISLQHIPEVFRLLTDFVYSF